LKDTIEGEGANSHVMDQLVTEINTQMAAGNFGMASSLGKDIKGLSGAQQELLAGQISANLLQNYTALRQAGRSNPTIDSNTKNIVEVAVSISNDLEKRGVAPTGPNQTNIRRVVEDVRTALNSTVPAQRDMYPRTWRVIAQPDEKP
jgi:hypothetical protein